MTKKQEDRTIILDNGEIVKATFPVVVSASRSTDIPSFYADWFFERLKKGYSAWTNPFNGKKSYVAYEDTRFIVFWSKNPRPLLCHIDYLKDRGIGCYVQYTLNDYEEEKLERGVPPIEERIKTFKLLVDKLGKGAVVWRFDPLILTDKIDMYKLLRKIEYIGDQLRGYTEKLVFSFADILSYRKVKANLERNYINYIDWTREQMIEFAEKLVCLNKNKGWNYILATCGESADLDGVEHNHCVDDRLIVRFGYQSKKLMTFLGVEIIDTKQQPDLFADIEPSEIPSDAILLGNSHYAVINKNNKDKGQRMVCGCMKSKDMGNTTHAHIYVNIAMSMQAKKWQLQIGSNIS